MSLRLVALVRTLPFLTLAGLFWTCSAPPAPPKPNQAPLAEAGDDQQVRIEEEVTLDGSLSSDPEGGSLRFNWRAASENPAPLIFAETQPRISFVPTIPGTYTFILIVSDGTLDSNPDSIRVGVAGAGNQAPRANAGPNLVVGANNPIPLSGLASDDPDGDPLSYQWAIISSPETVELVNATSREMLFTPTTTGEYRFRLTVDDGQLSGSDEIVVLVRTSGNLAPIADAGPDQQVATGDIVTLDGSLSTDPDGNEDNPMLIYRWIIGNTVDGTIQLSDSTAVQPTFIASEPGVYAFGLEVSDGDLTSLHDVITVRVLEQIFNEQSGMIEIPTGSFTMGSDQGAPDEGPPHRVELNLYWIDIYEVTAGQYQTCVDAGVCSAAGMTAGCNSVRTDRVDHPVNCVSWDQASTYCQSQGKRLPTEAEWERAARGDDGRNFPWGESFPSSELLNYNNNIGSTTPVGAYPLGVSFYGLHDLGGNVQEWTSDYYASDYYAQSPSKNPQGPESGALRVGRGSSWKIGVPIEVLSTTVRTAFVPDTINNSVGFRCASDLAPAP